MDNTISKLLDIFKHIARDIIIYVIPGFLLIFNLFIIDKLYLKKEILAIFQGEYLLLVIFILSYILGHVIMAVMEIVSCIEFLFKKCKWIKNKIEIDFSKELEIFKDNDSKKIYEYFIERENQLYYFRWNISGAFFVSAILNKYLLSEEFYIFLIPLIVGIFLLCLHYVTANNYKNRIEVVSKKSTTL